jgi:hypothetical protein
MEIVIIDRESVKDDINTDCNTDNSKANIE